MFYRIWELAYSKIFRALAVLVVLAGAVVGVVALAMRFEPPTPEGVVEQVAADAQTQFASKCNAAMAEIQAVTSRVRSLTLLDAARSEEFVELYLAAARDCTYAEFIEFDRTVVTPFANGASMFATANDGMFIDAADAAANTPAEANDE